VADALVPWWFSLSLLVSDAIVAVALLPAVAVSGSGMGCRWRSLPPRTTSTVTLLFVSALLVVSTRSSWRGGT